MLKPRAFLIGISIVGALLNVTASAQSPLAEAAAAAANIKHAWPLSSNTGAPAEPALTPAEIAAIDRSKFAKVYVAGKAVAAASYLSAVGVTPLQFQQSLLAFRTEISIVLDSVTTRGDKWLAGQYRVAELAYDLGYLERSNPEKHYGTDLMLKASVILEGANDVYLEKK